MCTHCTRRQFIGAGAVGGIALATGHLAVASGASNPPPAPNPKVRICVVIAGKPGDQSWGLSESDLSPIMKRLAQAEKNLGNVEFIIGRASNTEQTARLLDKAGPDAPVLAVSAD
ncbi:MAG: twin-arginine translocation signal domain-containing protein, partial [Planctomycetota bacterium]